MNVKRSKVRVWGRGEIEAVKILFEVQFLAEARRNNASKLPQERDVKTKATFLLAEWLIKKEADMTHMTF